MAAIYSEYIGRRTPGFESRQSAAAPIVPTTDPMAARTETRNGDRVDASVLIPVLNEERHIRETVAAMQAQRFDGDVEFLFMDGRSEARTKAIREEVAADDPRIRVFDNPRRSSTAGLNVGLRNARGDYIVRMDAHTFYPEDYIARGVERLRRGDVVWVAGPQVPYGVGKWSRRVALALGSWFGTGGSARWSGGEDGGRPGGRGLRAGAAPHGLARRAGRLRARGRRGERPHAAPRQARRRGRAAGGVLRDARRLGLRLPRRLPPLRSAARRTRADRAPALRIARPCG